MKPDLGRAIRIVRGARGLDQTHLAQLGGFDPSFVSLVEKGDRNPSLESLMQFSKALDVQPWMLLLLAEKPDASQPYMMEAVWRTVKELLK